MPLVSSTLQSELDKIFKSAAKAAFLSTYEFDTAPITAILQNSADLPQSVIDAAMTKQKTDMATAFAKAFSDNASADLAKAITDYILTATPVPTLAAPNGPVTGQIKLT
jgi:hypothetical protein